MCFCCGVCFNISWPCLQRLCCYVFVSIFVLSSIIVGNVNEETLPLWYSLLTLFFNCIFFIEAVLFFTDSLLYCSRKSTNTFVHFHTALNCQGFTCMTRTWNQSIWNGTETNNLKVFLVSFRLRHTWDMTRCKARPLKSYPFACWFRAFEWTKKTSFG